MPTDLLADLPTEARRAKAEAFRAKAGKKTNMYYVYILKSLKDKSLYIGVTKNLKRRIKKHNFGEVKYTKTKKPYKLIWFCVFANKEKSYKFEKYLKSGSGKAFTNKHLIII